MGTYFCTATAGAGIYYNEDLKAWLGAPFLHEKVQYIVKMRDTQRRIEKSYATFVKDKDGKEEIRGVPDMYPVVSVWVKEKGADDEQPCRDTYAYAADKLSPFGDEQVMATSYVSLQSPVTPAVDPQTAHACWVIPKCASWGPTLWERNFAAGSDNGSLRGDKFVKPKASSYDIARIDQIASDRSNGLNTLPALIELAGSASAMPRNVSVCTPRWKSLERL